MAFTIDPVAELQRALSAMASATIVGLPTKALSPGLKVRLAQAFKKIAGMLEKQARDEIGLTDERTTRPPTPAFSSTWLPSPKTGASRPTWRRNCCPGRSTPRPGAPARAAATSPPRSAHWPMNEENVDAPTRLPQLPADRLPR